MRYQTWSSMPSLNIPRSHHSLEYVDGKLLAIGGYDGDGTTAQVNIDTWYLIPLLQ